MRWPIPLAATVAAISLASNAFADKYDDLVAKGFRWATADGPYAAVSKDDAHRVATHLSDSEIIKLVEEVKVYYLTPGTLVQVTDEDKKAGLSKIRMAGITSDLWTLSSFLTRHPIKDTYGVIETPETSGLIPTSETIIDAGPTPAPPSFNAGPVPGALQGLTPGVNPVPGALESPTPGMSPVPGALESPTPSENLMPEESPSPGESPQPSASPTPGTTQ